LYNGGNNETVKNELTGTDNVQILLGCLSFILLFILLPWVIHLFVSANTTSWLMLNSSGKPFAGYREESINSWEKLSPKECIWVYNGIDTSELPKQSGHFTLLKLKTYTTGSAFWDFFPFVRYNNKQMVFSVETISEADKKELLNDTRGDDWDFPFHLYHSSVLLEAVIFAFIFVTMIGSTDLIKTTKRSALIWLLRLSVIALFVYSINVYVVDYYMRKNVFYSFSIFMDSIFLHALFVAQVVFAIVHVYSMFRSIKTK
jgi:hypothetical protein